MRRFTEDRKYLSIIAILLVLLLLQGCFAKKTGKSAEDLNGDSYKPVIVKDYFGREVTISKPVNRIACGYAYTGHVVTMLGRANDIVAVVNGLQRDKVLTGKYPHIKDLPVPFSSGAINMEELLLTKPDLVFLRETTASDESVTSKLNQLNIPYIVIEFTSIDEQIESISAIGKAIGEEEKADRYIAYYKKVMEDTKKVSSTIPEDERVTLYHSVNEAVRTDIEDSLAADWIKITAGINVSIEDKLKTSGEKSFATLEQIYLWDPDIIIANESGVPDYMLSNEQWAGLRAVKEKRVYQIPNGVSRWGHPGSLETPLAILWTSKLLYPQYFEHINLEEETKKYYEEFFDILLDDVEVAEILRGEGMREPKTNK
ncbi:MAG: ABC transporter substrate-binding protein [Natronincolaceae bacterium]|nr:ABC transporter substrate-binding protein [Bacillota bacterium]NLK91127.1 ABC transporter substrate-binding protein [Clostridiales bacterium]